MSMWDGFWFQVGRASADFAFGLLIIVIFVIVLAGAGVYDGWRARRRKGGVDWSNPDKPKVTLTPNDLGKVGFDDHRPK